MIKAVVFDLDGTLLDRQASIVQFAQQQHSKYEQLQTVTTEDYVRSFVELDDDGHVWKDAVYQQLIAKYTVEGVAWQTLLQDYVDNFASSCVGFADMHHVLEGLQRDGYLLGMITNGRSPFQEHNVEALKIEGFFSTILVSGAVGLRKPEKAIFEKALGHLNLKADEAVFVGDSPKSDIAGAQNAGMKAIWKHSDYWGACEQADAICHQLMELPEIIRQL